MSANEAGKWKRLKQGWNLLKEKTGDKWNQLKGKAGDLKQWYKNRGGLLTQEQKNWLTSAGKWATGGLRDASNAITMKTGDLANKLSSTVDGTM